MIEIQPPENKQIAGWHQQTVAEVVAQAIAEGKPVPYFSEDYSDDATRKDYGHLVFEASQLPANRVVGVYGTRKIRWEEPFFLDRGHRSIRFKASAQKPITCNAVLCVFAH
jgi:hypothetical protein